MSQSFDAVRSLPHTFRGGLAFNQRTVAAAVAALLNETASGKPARGTPLGITELTNILVLLESVAMSNGLYLDGTLPPKDIGHLQSILWRVRAQSGVPLTIEFIRPPAAELPAMFHDAAEAASLLIARDLELLDAQRDTPIEGEISGFIDAVRMAGNDPSGRLSAEFAAKTAADVVEGRESFRGSKCAAGLLLAATEDVPIVERVLAHLDAADDQTQRKVIALLINRFRINYVNSVAGFRDAAYLADVSIEDLKAAQVLLFSRYLAGKIVTSDAELLSEATRQAFDRHFAAAPVGFAILLNSPGSSVLGLLEEAMRVRDLSFSAAAARATPQSRFVHQFSAEEFAAFQDYLFKSQWIALMNENERAVFSRSELREVKIPAAIGAAVGAIIGAVAAGPLGAVAGSVVGSVVEHLSEQLATGRLGKRAVNVDQYRRLRAYLSLAAKNDRVATPLRDKVETVFGRPLTLT
ncbi:MAG TPA: hypothetical protein VGQ36_10920 [Thermoanaerobaculia bacterium]|jgi:uncharacterized membrane protein|nr:hypothetical protein [Thermoanaerobaculia bacterium]